jgi:hypothetical protein
MHEDTKAAIDELKAKDRKDPQRWLCENYVLDCIGALPNAEQEQLRRTVSNIFGGGQDWKATFRKDIVGVTYGGERVPVESFDDDVRRFWDQERALAEEAGAPLTPVAFAMKFVAERVRIGFKVEGSAESHAE